MSKLNNSLKDLMISLLFFAISISLFSCQKDRGLRTEESFGTYRLEQEKEFLIHSLTSVEILDYYPEDSLYLGYTNTLDGKEICLINEDGDIIISQNMQGEGPEQHPSNLSCLGFSENGDIWAMTSVQVLRYDQNLKLLKRFSYTPDFMISLYKKSKKFSYFRKDTNKTEITFATIPSGTSRFSPRGRENYHKATLMELYDQKLGYSKEIAPISERRVTKEFLSIAGGFYSPVYVIDGSSNKLYLTGTFDNELTIYDLKADTVTGRLEIYHGDPDALDPSTAIDPQNLSTNPDGWLLSPKNQNVHKLDNGLIVLEYIMGASINPKPGNHEAEIHQDIYQNRLILFDQDRQLSGDFTIPVQGVIMTSLPGNRLLIKAVNPEKEEDFTRYIICRVIRE